MKPERIITWYDKKNTGAVGWIVIHNLVNGIAGGGLFMSNSASLHEVTDLAYTMSLKNSLQMPRFGGGKGGIRFDVNDPRAKDVLKRFLKDNVDVIRKYWCTGGDINTNTENITEILTTCSSLKSPFDCLAKMLRQNLGVNPCINTFNARLQEKGDGNMSIGNLMTGFSMYASIENIVNRKGSKPKIVLQGLGKIGKAFCTYARDKYDIVGICERDWFVVNPDGINTDKIIETIHDSSIFKHFKVQERYHGEYDIEFLCRFIKKSKADIFCPCAGRYSINDKILDTLVNYTFSSSRYSCIVAGANNVFTSHELVDKAFLNGITVVPEWVSNSGNALLFLETLKQSPNIGNWGNYIKGIVSTRLSSFLSKAKDVSQQDGISIYQACFKIIQQEEVA